MMSNPFLISESLLSTLRATRQGRVTVGGYNYQAAFAVARLSVMIVRQPFHGLSDWPIRLRYDWADDLDEVCNDESVRFTQCKKESEISQPHSLATILTGFAPKWLWTPDNSRPKVRFRLACADQRFMAGGPLNSVVSTLRDAVRDSFLQSLARATGERADRRLWQSAGDAYGHERLFDELWNTTDALYVGTNVYLDHPAGMCLEAEREAIRVLLERGQIDSDHQKSVLDRLRRLVHENLIAFDPTSMRDMERPPRSPDHLEREQVAVALFEYHPHWNPRRGGLRLPFDVVDRTFLDQMRKKRARPFVARPPEWSDVVRGEDKEIRFLERTQTLELRRKLLETVIEPIERGTDRRLHALFVVGAPGSGKTTITRRVAAMLVAEKRVVVADPGVNHNDPRLARPDYVRALDELAEAGAPVLLVLDDPLYADSGWFDLLHKLARPGFRGGVLGATPHFLYEKYIRLVTSKGIDCHRFDLGGPTEQERLDLARLHGRAEVQVDAGVDDFLVLAMEIAAGMRFDEIIDRMWNTLNDGRPIIGQQEISQLSWPARALLVVSFFHRADLPCPEPLLGTALEQSGGVGSGVDVANALRQMQHESGWSIFRSSEHARRNWDYQGVLWTANHVRIAQHAWRRRPLAWCNAGDLVVRSSVKEPRTVRYVGELAAALIGNGEEQDRAFVGGLIESWRLATVAGSVEIRQIYDFASALLTNDHRDLASRLTDVFRSKATATKEGWLAALQLWFMSSEDDAARRFSPAELDLCVLINAADFSIAPSRAVQFGNAVRHQSAVTHAFHQRLLASLEGNLSWRLDGSLMSWLLATAPPDAIVSHASQVQQWFDDHPDDTGARPQFLDFLIKLPKNFDELRRSAAYHTMQWLNSEKHAHDVTVRAKFLDFISHPLCDFDDLRRSVAAETEKWLQHHPVDRHVRVQYLDYLLAVSKRLENRQRGQGSPSRSVSTNARREQSDTAVDFSKEFGVLRRSAAAETAKWLNLENHRHDMTVRVKYLNVLGDPLCNFEEVRENAVVETEKWLKEHEDDEHVRAQWLTFLGNIHHAGLPLALRETLAWLEGHNSPIVAGALLTTVVKALDVDLVCRALEWAARFIKGRGWLRSDQVVVSSMLAPYRYVFKVLVSAAGPAETQEMLSEIRQSIETWRSRNPDTNVKPI